MRVIIHLPVRLNISAEAAATPNYRILHGVLQIETAGGGWHEVGLLSDLVLTPAPGLCTYASPGTGGPSIHLGPVGEA